MSAQVHAPYHFVPLSKWVYLPEWAHLVSHDYPFKDGLSGSIELSLKNKTELLVGAESVKKGEKETSIVKWARTPDGKPVIPGSSMKGMLRSFLEVATFSKFKQVDESRFAYRDISSSGTKYSKILSGTEPKAAWLVFDTVKDKWQYKKCKHTRLYSKELNAYLKKQGSDKTIDNGNSEQKTLAKYEIWPLSKAAISFEFGEHFTKNDKSTECAVRLGAGSEIGTPVFVGYRPGKGEDLNFNYMFYDVDDKALPIDNELVNQMFAAHDQELVKYLKENAHPKHGIPIFIRESKNEIVALGFAMMPKMLYKSSIAELAARQQNDIISNDASFDFCELLFGSLRDFGIGLKSRVYFGDLLCTRETKIAPSSAVILGQPKASYLNAYLEQTHKDGVLRGELAMYEPNSKLSGWKRYPTQSKFNAHLPDDLKDKTAVQSKLELLEPGAEFSGRVVFHNLKPEELGALLWAINPNKSFYHGLGHGKSLGAGAVQLEAKLNLRPSDATDTLDAQMLEERFIEHMTNQYPMRENSSDTWLNSAQIMHLLAFGDMQDNSNKNLSYMPLQKGAAAVTYSNSKVSGSRKALPNWQVGTEDLSRDEKLGVLNDYAPKGRLYELVERVVSKETQRESMEEARKKEQQIKEQQAEKLLQEQAREAIEAQKAEASPLFVEFLDFRQYFEDNRGKDNLLTVKHHELTALLNKAITVESGLSKAEIKEIVDFVSNTEPARYIGSKAAGVGKKKLKERRDLVQQLTALC